MPRHASEQKTAWVERFVQLSGVALEEEQSVPPVEDQPPSKSHQDPLRADPKIAALLDQRADVQRKMRGLFDDSSTFGAVRKEAERMSQRIEQLGPDKKKAAQEREQLEAELGRLVESAVAENKDLSGLSQQYDQLTKQLEKELRRLNEQGISPQPRQAEYQDEEKKYGWRADIIKGLKDWQKDLLRETIITRTKYFDAAERDASELQIGIDGKIRRPTGDILGDSHDEMVINPESGKMHEFKPRLSRTGETIVDPLVHKSRDAVLKVHHSSVLSGGEVTSAGNFATNIDGSLAKVTNLSGHYKPGIDKLLQSVETLLKQGAFLDKSWVGAKDLKGKGQELLNKTKEVIDTASRHQAWLRENALRLKRTIEQDPDADVSSSQASLESQQKQLKAMFDAVAKAQQILAKLGVSQKNKMKGEVEYLQIDKGMTGLEVKQASQQAKTKTQGVQEFLKTGGGKASEAVKKDAMLKELEAVTAGRRRELDASANPKTKGSSDLPYDVDAVLEDLAQALDEITPDQRKTEPTAKSRKSKPSPAQVKTSTAVESSVEINDDLPESFGVEAYKETNPADLREDDEDGGAANQYKAELPGFVKGDK